MGCKYWTEYRRLFLISNFLLVTMLLCLTSLFLPYWFVVDFYPNQLRVNKPINVNTQMMPTTTPITTTTIGTVSTPVSTSNPSNRKKRDASLGWVVANSLLRRRKRQAIDKGKVFDDLVIPKVHVGLFYMLYPSADFMFLEEMSIRMVSLIHLEKNSPDFVVPRIMYIAQIFYSFGMFALTLSTAGIFILACRKYSSVVGEIAISGSLMFSTVMLVVGVVLAGIHTEGEIWDDFPVMNTVILNRAPEVTLDWGYYFALVGPLLAILCSVLAWSQACATCMDVEEIRKQQMKEVIISPEVAYQPLVTDRPYKVAYDNTIVNPDPNIMTSRQEKAWEAGVGEEFSI